ncbi:MAG: DNA-binding protein WhiA [Clostridia bacterium]|nr:DNA-binding protein WhiA [Clostridia bacterium]
MSFSGEVKEILCKTQYECPGCRLAELAGFFACTGRISDDELRFTTSIPVLQKRIRASLLSELGIKTINSGKQSIISSEDLKKLKDEISGDVCIYECCNTAYIRGAFLGGGSVNSPDKKYHLEFDAKTESDAERLVSILEEYDFRPKIMHRKERFVAYIKESSQIADLLGYISDGRVGLEFLSAQVEKELKSSAQRMVNCDSANLNKLAMASSRHITAIKKIKAARKWSSMPDVLKEIGELRLKNPDLSLEALGKMTSHGIGKSGVNHRLNRIVEYADSIGKD